MYYKYHHNQILPLRLISANSPKKSLTSTSFYVNSIFFSCFLTTDFLIDTCISLRSPKTISRTFLLLYFSASNLASSIFLVPSAAVLASLTSFRIEATVCLKKSSFSFTLVKMKASAYSIFYSISRSIVQGGEIFNSFF